jgi:formylglycine-generating enzyme required for sulfatase activity
VRAPWHGWPADAPAPAIAPFDADQAKKHQENWATYLKVPVEYTNSIGMKLRLIPPGEPKLHPDVRVGLQPLNLRHTQAIFASIHKVTVANFRQFVIGSGYVTIGETGNRGGVYYPFPPQPPVHKPEYIWSHPQFAPADDVPVTMVSWHDAKAFCDWLTSKERAAGRLDSAQAYRLPRDEEWSRAVGLPQEVGVTPREKHAQNKKMYPWGTQWPPPKGAGNFAGEEAKTADWPIDFAVISHYDDGYPCTSPVGSFETNGCGLYDMGGNVWQKHR